MAKIGVFDSGYGGLTILKEIRKVLPEYDYLYLGDNARAPYGTHSFDVIYRYTLEAVKYLFEQDCALVILACNTASAKALRTIQQKDLPGMNGEGLRVTGYGLQEPVHELVVTQQACPMWVPLIEAGEHESDGAKYFVGKYMREILAKDPQIDTLVLGCTHYPLLKAKIEGWLRYHEEIAESEFPVPAQTTHIRIISQGTLVADSLKDYLNRHPEYREQLSEGGSCAYLTTENADRFSQSASLFLDCSVCAEHVDL